MAEKVRKLYSINEISLASLIGGPLAGFYLISTNFEVLDKKSLSNTNFILGIIAAIFLGVVIVLIPQDIMDKVPGILIPALFVPPIYFYAKKVQGQEIKEYFNNGGIKHSLRETVGISVLALIITLASFFAVGTMAGSVNISAP
jgi:hypothetical protein